MGKVFLVYQLFVLYSKTRIPQLQPSSRHRTSNIRLKSRLTGKKWIVTFIIAGRKVRGLPYTKSTGPKTWTRTRLGFSERSDD